MCWCVGVCVGVCVDVCVDVCVGVCVCAGVGVCVLSFFIAGGSAKKKTQHSGDPAHMNLNSFTQLYMI